MTTVAIANEFLTAFARIPRAKQRAVRDFTIKFRDNPQAASINYEKIRDMRDTKVRTVRIGKDYRAIVLHPGDGDVFVLVWVDNHDEAMDWAKNKQFDINPYTGALQIINVVEVERVVEKSKAEPAPAVADVAATPTAAPVQLPVTPSLFAAVDDQTLLSLGVPPLLMPAIRAIADTRVLPELAQYLPDECTEALTWLAEGIPLEEIREALAVDQPSAPVDIENFEKALEHPDTKRRFAKIDDVDALAKMLEQPLEKWRIFLHPSQERLVRREYKGTMKVTGGAGTGKTVVAMHRARYLAKELYSKQTDRVLFTTFTSNLARNVAQNLDELCGDEREQIEVNHLHAWAVGFMRSQGVTYNIAMGKVLNRYWSDAYAAAGISEFDVGFIRQEWEHVAQPQGVRNRKAYFKASRIGRGRRLSRAQRAEIWKAFEEFIAQLRSDNRVEWIEVMRETRQYLERHGNHQLPYRAIVVDEAQDFHEEEWQLLRAMVDEGPNDIFLVGDAHQRIYGRRVTLSKCGINTRGRRSRRLFINYRTTEQIRDWAMAVLRNCEIDDLDGETEKSGQYKSLRPGVAPQIRSFDNARAEQEWLVHQILDLTAGPTYELRDICLVARTRSSLRRNYVAMLEKAKIEYVVLDKDGEPDADGVRLATMHRVKGLEFPVMLLAGTNDNEIPLPQTTTPDPVTQAEHEQQERALLFVAATRARDKLYVTSNREPSRYLASS